MTPQEFRAAYPKVIGWIRKVLAKHRNSAKPVASLKFRRLPLYFSQNLLSTAKFISLEEIPIPPLSDMGLAQFAAFEHYEFSGITYLDTYFIERTSVEKEALHFHELIHVIQWDLLGPEAFLWEYSREIESKAYRNCLLEKMAWEAEAKFKQSRPMFDAVKFVAKNLLQVSSR
jgi:hypothetical protein